MTYTTSATRKSIERAHAEALSPEGNMQYQAFIARHAGCDHSTTPTEPMRNLIMAAAEQVFMSTYTGSRITARGAFLRWWHGEPAVQAPAVPTLQDDRAELASLISGYAAGH